MSKTNFTFNTVDRTASAQFKDRGSRFLGFCFPVSTTEAVKENLRQLKQEHPKANINGKSKRHKIKIETSQNRTGYKMMKFSDGTISRYSDDCLLPA